MKSYSCGVCNHHLGVHIDYRYVFLCFMRMYLIVLHCSSPTVLSHVPFVAFVLELCTVQCLLSVHVLHTTMYYLVVVYHTSLYAVPSKQTRPMISCALVQCSFANPCSLFHLLTRSFSFLSLILIVYEKLYVRSIDAPLRCTSRLQVCFPLIYSCVHRIYALFLAYRTEPCTVCRIRS